MAKKDKEIKTGYAADIEKQYGAGILVDASFVLDEPPMVIPIGPSLDLALSGGIPTGSWVICSGQPKIGKTSSFLQFAANAQKEEYGSRKVFYADIEGRLKAMNLRGIHGLDLSPEKFQIIRSTPEKILSAEDFLNILISLIKSEPGAVFIIDSASALCSSKELVEEISGQTRSLGPKLFASFCRQMGNVVPVQKSIVIVIQHLIANTSGYGAPYVEDGGQKLKYQVDTKLRAKKVDKWEVGDKQIGQVITWEVICSALGPPGKQAESYLRYNYGIDEELEIILMACDLGAISKGGAWYTLEFLEERTKVQGLEGLVEMIRNNPSIMKTIREKVYKSLK